MKTEIILNNKEIKDMIFETRGVQVMLDSDLAILYQVETKRINEAVKNNPLKFPERYAFKLTKDEFSNLRSKISTSSWNQYGGRRYNPRVFTEQGVAMLATILKSDIATKVSIAIMDTFVMMRKYIANNNYNNRISNMESKLIEHDMKLDKIFDQLEFKANNHIFFEGQIYDAYSLMIDIFKEAKDQILIIDNYIDKNLLDILATINTRIVIITNRINKYDMEKYNKQYYNIEIKISQKFHDRFIILDKEVLYHSGASFKDLGKKCFAITKIDDNEILLHLLNELKKEEINLL